MPRRNQEKKHLRSTKVNNKQSTKTSKQLLKTALCVKQNIIRKCCVRVKRGYGQKNCKSMATKKSSQESKITANSSLQNKINKVSSSEIGRDTYEKGNEIVILNDSSDEDDPSQNSPELSVLQQLLTENCGVAASTNNDAVASAKEEKSNTNQNKNSIYGFIGVEYVVKICGRNGEATRFECVLCELNLGFYDMQQHLLGHSHRLKFCGQHFPSAIQQLRELIANVSKDMHNKVMIPLLQKLAEAIEKHHGRAQPFECNHDRFKNEPHWVMSKVFLRFHVSEQNGPTFISVIDPKEVDKLINECNSINSSETIVTEPIFDNLTSSYVTTKEVKINTQMPKGFILKIGSEMRTHFQISQPYHLDVPFFVQPRIESQSCAENIEQTYEQSQHCFSPENYHSSAQPQNRVLRGSSQDIWRNYCRYVDQELSALNEHFWRYRANPETYPMYHQEYSQYCQNRTAELRAMGKDCRNHDYHSEWALYFQRRLMEQFEATFESIKLQIRKDLSLPQTNDFALDAKYHVNVNLAENRENRMGSSTFVDSQSPIESSVIDLTNSPERSVSFKIEDSETPTLVSLLGLLVALEAYLGSLAPKIVDLLTKALRAEKLGSDYTFSLINIENCSLLETVMEKFKGIVIVGSLDSSNQDALRKAIRKVDTFLDAARKFIKK